MKILKFLLVLIIAAATAYLVTASQRKEEGKVTVASGYAHVKEAREIRCSYASLYPYIIIDPNTKQLSGIFYDIMNEIGKRTDLKVTWVEEVGWGNINQGFDTGRYDAFCTGLWPSGVRSPTTVFSAPIVYDIVTGWVRASDTRFDNQIDKLNDPTYTITAFEGDTTMSIAQNQFPKAKIFPISQGQDVAAAYLAVAQGRADALFNTVTDAKRFAKDNPNSIKQADSKPVRVLPLALGFPETDSNMKHLVDPVILEMQDDGFIRNTAIRYLGADQDVIHFAAKPYDAAK